jgi:hypothetical protein
MDYPEHMRPYVEEQMRPVRDVRVERDFRVQHQGFSIRKNPQLTPIVINNFNRLTYLRETVESLRTRGYENLYVIDNASTYAPLLDYYDESGLNVFRLSQNVGYLALWRTPVFKEFINNFYVYTDSDVVPEESCPADIIAHLKRVLDRFPDARKAGLGLRIEDLPEHYALREQVIAHEAQFWKQPIAEGLFSAPIDTTFALYRRGVVGGWWLPAIRTDAPYLARHLPWYADSDNPTDEERQYLQTATGSTHWTQSEGVLVDTEPGPGIAEYFDHIYCISLARRADRWEQAAAQFAEMGLEVERFEAVDGRTLEGVPDRLDLAMPSSSIPAVVGCSLSHRLALADAAEKGYERVLVLEDDVEFAPDADAQFSRYIGQVPDDWMMLYLGGNHQGGIEAVAPNVARIGGTYTTSSYAVTGSMARSLLGALPERPDQVRVPVDVFFSGVHRMVPSYVFRPHLAWQRDGFSDIDCADVDYGFLRD